MDKIGTQDSKHLQEYEDWKGKLQKYYDRFSKRYKAYTGYKKDKEGTSSKITDPMCFELIERLVPFTVERTPEVIPNLKVGEYLEEIIRASLDKKEEEEVLATAKDIFSRSENTVKAMLEYNFDNPERSEHSESMVSLLSPVVREFYITGNCAGEVYWNVTRETVKIENEDGEAEFKSKVVYDAPDFRPLPVERVIFNPAKTLVDSDVYYIRKYMTLDELKAEETRDVGEDKTIKKGIYKNISKLEDIIKNKDRIVPVTEERVHRSENIDEDAQTEPIEIIERWEGAHLTVFAKGIVIRDEHDPFAIGTNPLVIGSLYRLNNQPFGYGELDSIYDMAKAKDTITNQKIDLINKALKPPLRIDSSDQSLRPESLKNAYVLGGPVYASQGSIDYLPTPRIPQEAFMQPQEFQARAEATTGLSGYVGGVPQAYSDKTQGTKGGTLAIIEQAQPRIKLKTQSFESQIIKPIFIKWLKMLASLMGDDEHKWFLVGETSQEWMAVTKETLMGRIGLPTKKGDDIDEEAFDLSWIIDIETGSAAAQDKQIELDNFYSAVQMGKEAGVQFKPEKIWTEVAKKIGIKQPKDYLYDKTDKEAAQQLMAQEQAQQGMDPNMGGMPQQGMIPPEAMGQLPQEAIVGGMPIEQLQQQIPPEMLAQLGGAYG